MKKSGFSFSIGHLGGFMADPRFSENCRNPLRSPRWPIEKLKPDFFLKYTFWTTSIPTLCRNYQKQRIFSNTLIWQKRTFALAVKSYETNLKNKIQIFSQVPPSAQKTLLSSWAGVKNKKVYLLP